METQRRLRTNRDALLEQYFANLDDVYNLQDTLIQSVLPSVTDELGLGSEAQEWAKEWLSDTRNVKIFSDGYVLTSIQATMFRISRVCALLKFVPRIIS